jgi:S-adenosylmethionine hydrolase
MAAEVVAAVVATVVAVVDAAVGADEEAIAVTAEDMEAVGADEIADQNFD